MFDRLTFAGFILGVFAHPESVNVLSDVTDDIRTPDKLVCDNYSEEQMWLAPVLPNTVRCQGIYIEKIILMFLEKIIRVFVSNSPSTSRISCDLEMPFPLFS